MPIDPSNLARSIGALDSLDPERGLAPTLQQVTDGAKQLFRADGAGLMLVDAEGQLRWASASDQTAQTVEDEQERLAQGPCAVAFSQRLPAAIRDLRTEPHWQEFTQVLAGEGICAALSVPSGPGPVLGPGCPGRRCFWPGRWDRSAWRCLPFWYLVGEPVSRPGSKRRPRASPWQMPVTTTADDLAGSLTGPRSQT